MGQILPFTYEQNALDPEDLAIAASAYEKAVVDIGTCGHWFEPELTACGVG